MHILPAYEEIWKDRTLFQVIAGTAGSGKSQYGAGRILHGALTEKGQNFLCVRKVATTLRDSVFAELKMFIERENWGAAFEIQENSMRIKCLANQNIILCKGCDDVNKFKSIVGVRKIWFEEAVDFERKEVMQFLYRLRGTSKWPKQMIFTFNKSKANSWLKQDFFDKQHPQAKVLETTYAENPYITEEDRYAFEVTAKADPAQYKVYTLNQWADIGGEHNFYYNFNVQKHISETEIRADASSPLHISFDFNRNPYTTCLVFQHIAGKFIQLDEICLRHPKSNSYDVALFFKEKYLDLLNKRCGLFIYGDPAGMQGDTRHDLDDYAIIMEVLKDFHPTLRVEKSAPGLKARYDFINRGFSGFFPGIQILINKKCYNTIEDFCCIQQTAEGTKLKEKATEKGKQFERIGHCSDAYDYCFTSFFNEQFESFFRPVERFAPIFGNYKAVEVWGQTNPHDRYNRANRNVW